MVVAAASSDHAVVVAATGAVATVTVAILGALAAYMAAKRERRRLLYSEAVRAAIAWHELLYRVRRRAEDEGRELVHRFHDAQDELSYHQAWVASDSRYMAKSYARLVRSVKDATESLIQDAWREPPRPLPGDALPTDVHPDVSAERDAFMVDVRSHLSPLPWRRVALMWRNRQEP